LTEAGATIEGASYPYPAGGGQPFGHSWYQATDAHFDSGWRQRRSRIKGR